MSARLLTQQSFQEKPVPNGILLGFIILICLVFLTWLTIALIKYFTKFEEVCCEDGCPPCVICDDPGGSPGSSPKSSPGGSLSFNSDGQACCPGDCKPCNTVCPPPPGPSRSPGPSRTPVSPSIGPSIGPSIAPSIAPSTIPTTIPSSLPDLPSCFDIPILQNNTKFLLGDIFKCYGDDDEIISFYLERSNGIVAKSSKTGVIWESGFTNPNQNMCDNCNVGDDTCYLISNNGSIVLYQSDDNGTSIPVWESYIVGVPEDDGFNKTFRAYKTSNGSIKIAIVKDIAPYDFIYMIFPGEKVVPSSDVTVQDCSDYKTPDYVDADVLSNINPITCKTSTDNFVQLEIEDGSFVFTNKDGQKSYIDYDPDNTTGDGTFVLSFNEGIIGVVKMPETVDDTSFPEYVWRINPNPVDDGGCDTFDKQFVLNINDYFWNIEDTSGNVIWPSDDCPTII